MRTDFALSWIPGAVAATSATKNNGIADAEPMAHPERTSPCSLCAVLRAQGPAIVHEVY
jgi:hypothetical protein